MSDERKHLEDEGADDVSPVAPVADSEAEVLAFEVYGEDANTRLDAFLAARVEGVSRTTLKRAIEDGDALVDGHAAKPSYKLRAGERIEVELTEPPASNLTPEDIPLDIVYEDDDVVVVNKPAGMVVHPAAGVHAGTLANALAFRFAQLRIEEEQSASSPDSTDAAVEDQRPTNPQSAIRNPQLISPQSLRPGIVHRLDRDTSGLVVVAKNARAHENLSEQFRARTVFKSYVALVHGVVKEDKGKIEQPLARDTQNRTRMAVRKGGRAALSLWRARRRFARFTLLDVQIKTGRTHQIRVHLAWMKHPVVGDEVYGMGRDGNLQDTHLRRAVAALGRQFLHAERLGFHQPTTGEWMSFTSPLPPELDRLIEFLDSL